MLVGLTSFVFKFITYSKNPCYDKAHGRVIRIMLVIVRWVYVRGAKYKGDDNRTVFV